LRVGIKKMNVIFRKHKITLIIFLCLSFLILVLEMGERKNSFLKAWLYENNITNELLVATVAMTPHKDPGITREKITELILDIKKSNPKIDLIVFGEVILGWYRAETKEYHETIAENIPGITTSLISRLAKELNVNISFGMAERSDNRIFNSQILIDHKGEVIHVQRKKNLKSSFFSPGQEPISFVDIKGIRTGIVICYDMRWPETIKSARDNNADLIILSNSDYIDEWDDIYFGYRYLARQYGAWIVTANRYGNEFETNWDGHIEILSPFGDLEVSAKSEEQYLVHNLRVNKARSKGKKLIGQLYSKLSIGYLIIKHPKIVLSYL
jgi:predicted amidohydrolase